MNDNLFLIKISSKKYLIITILALVLFLEFLNKVGFIYNLSRFTISSIFKLSFIVFSIFLILKNKANKKRLWVLISFCILLFINIVIYQKDLTTHFFVYGTRYLYFIFIIAFVDQYNNLSLERLLKSLDFILMCNSIFIVLGLAFQIELFSTYHQNRFGYNGMLNVVSDTNYLYCLYALFSIFHYRLKTTIFKIITIFILLISLLTGTKTVIIGSLIALFYISFFYERRLLVLYCILILTALYFRELIYSKFQRTAEIFKNLYAEQGLLSSITSTRFYNLNNTIDVYQNDTNFLNMLFHNISFIQLRVEMELFDILIFWGFIGSAFYFFSFYYLNRPFVFPNMKNKIVFVSILFISFFAGKFLTNFIALYVMYIYFSTQYVNCSELNS